MDFEVVVSDEESDRCRPYPKVWTLWSCPNGQPPSILYLVGRQRRVRQRSYLHYEIYGGLGCVWLVDTTQPNAPKQMDTNCIQL